MVCLGERKLRQVLPSNSQTIFNNVSSCFSLTEVELLHVAEEKERKLLRHNSLSLVEFLGPEK